LTESAPKSKAKEVQPWIGSVRRPVAVSVPTRVVKPLLRALSSSVSSVVSC
jgi:hypothetical protein